MESSRRKVHLKPAFCCCLDKMSGLLSSRPVCCYWNSFRECSHHWPEQSGSPSRGAQGPSVPHTCGLPCVCICLSSSSLIFQLHTCLICEFRYNSAKICSNVILHGKRLLFTMWMVCVLCEWCVCVSFYRFDQGGNFLLCTSDRHVHVLHAKPSKGFSVIGYTGRCFF